MTIGASVIQKNNAKKTAVKQFLEQSLGKKSLTQTLKQPHADGSLQVDRMKQTGTNFTMSDIKLDTSNALNSRKVEGSSLPVEGKRYPQHMGQTMYSQQMRNKNLRINRNNIANIQLDKKGQAV